jgi:2-amino-4-hydroxy-6-hydroxymethyldihydropteridine diphosphokinase
MKKEELTRYLKKLEDRLGRDRTLPKFGPRVIDLDVIVWNSEIVDDDYYKRDFVKKTVDELK